MNMSPYRLSMDCPWTLPKVARPAGLAHAGDERSESRACTRDCQAWPTRQRRVGAPGRSRTCDPRLRRPPVLGPPARSAGDRGLNKDWHAGIGYDYAGYVPGVATNRQHLEAGRTLGFL